jgi:glycosyltransferase involved in cell wall biosynthesis
MKRRRILFLNYEFPPLGSGAANATKYLFEQFSKRDDIAIDLVTSSISTYKEEQFSAGIRVFRLDIGKDVRHIQHQSQKDLITYSIKAYRFAKTLLRDGEYDFVHAFFGIPCGLIAYRLGLPYIVSLRGTDVPFYNDRFAFLDKLIFKRFSSQVVWKHARYVIANSEGLRDLALQSSPKQVISVIPNGIDTEFFHPPEGKAFSMTSQEDFRLVYVGRITPRKGLDLVVQAMSKLIQLGCSNIQFTIVGDGSAKTELESLVRRLGLEGAVTFMGRIPHEEVVSYYGKADVLIMPSKHEGMSNTILEAMACGLPIVITNTGGTKELVDDANGRVLEDRSVGSIVTALRELHDDRSLLESMSRTSRRKAISMSWSRSAEQYVSFYETF